VSSTSSPTSPLTTLAYYEINLLFQKKLPARQFKGTVIDANSEEAIREQQLGGH
jgi:hypothetical protein